MKSKFVISLLWETVLFFLFLTHSYTADIFYGGGTDAGLGANWGGGVLPGVGDNAYFLTNGTNATLNAASNVATLSTSNFVISDTTGSTVTFNLGSGGVVTTSGFFVVGRNGNGVMNMTGGTVNATGSGVIVSANNTGVAGPTGALTQSGGTINASNFIIASNSFGNGSYTISGSGILAATSISLAAGNSNTATMTINGGSATSSGSVTLTTAASATATLNLNGGTLTAASVADGGGTSTFKFNGGTLISSATTATFLEGLDNAYIESGGGTIDSNGFNITIAQILQSPSAGGTGGTLTKTGTGILTLSGANTMNGGVSVTGGTLRAGVATNAFGSNTAVSLSNTAGAILDLNGFSNTIGSLAGGGTTGGNVTLGTATLTTGGDNASTSYGGVISGTGAVIKNGTGTQTFTGTNTTTGTLTINGGSGIIGTSLGGSWAGDVITNSGGRLGGNGTIGGSVTINSGATYAVGNSPGIQSILGNLTLASGSRTEIEIGGATAGNGAGFHDQINVTGTVTIQSGATIAPMTIFSGSSGYSPTVGQRFAAITGSAITGTFDTIDNSGNPAWVSFIPEYTGTVVYMRTTASEFANNPLLNLSNNESAVGRALDSFRPATIVTGANATDADRIYGALTLLNNDGVKSAISQMSPEKLAAMPQVAQSIGSQTHGQVNRQLELRRGFQPTQGDLSIYNRNGQTVYEPVAGVLTDALFIKRKPEKLSFFASVNGEQGEVKPSQQRTDYDYWTATAVYGGNYALSQSLNLGLFTGYGHSNTSLGGAGGEIDYDTGKFGGYLSWSDEGWFVNGTLSGGKSFYKTERRIAFLSETAKGKTEAWEGVGELRAGKDLSCGKWTLSPSIWQRYSQTFIDSYQEKGSSARLNIRSMKPESMVSGAGVTLQRAFPMGGMSLIPRVYANYEREWIRSQEIRAGFAAGGTTFQISTDPIDADQLTAGLGTTWMVSEAFQIDLSVEAETLQNDLQRRSANLSCKFSF